MERKRKGKGKRKQFWRVAARRASYRGDNWDKEEEGEGCDDTRDSHERERKREGRVGGACSSADAAYGLYSNER